MNNNLCTGDHHYFNELKELPHSKSAEDGRYKCAVCAYSNGYEEGRESKIPNFTGADNLPYNRRHWAYKKIVQRLMNRGIIGASSSRILISHFISIFILWKK